MTDCTNCGEYCGHAHHDLSHLRDEFHKMLTADIGTDRRRKDTNVAIFDPDRGYAVFNGTDLWMVMEKFDRAVKNVS